MQIERQLHIAQDSAEVNRVSDQMRVSGWTLAVCVYVHGSGTVMIFEKTVPPKGDSEAVWNTLKAAMDVIAIHGSTAPEFEALNNARFELEQTRR